MPVKFFTYILKDTHQGKFLSLLIAILLYLGIIPLIDRFIRVKFLIDILFSVVLLSAIFAVSQKKHHGVIALALGVPMLAMYWVEKFILTDRLWVLSHLLAAVFLGYTIIRMLNFIFTQSRVTRNVLFAAIIVYLLMGLTWAQLYQVLNHLQPGTFEITGIQTQNPNLVLVYYSYVTLTTLGYGDISPLTDLGYSLAILEAILGQLYLAVLVARLVGLHIAHTGSRRESLGTEKKDNPEAP